MDQNFIPASEARKLAEERLVIFRNERKDNIIMPIKDILKYDVFLKTFKRFLIFFI